MLPDASDVDWNAMIQLNTHVSEGKAKSAWVRDTDN